MSENLDPTQKGIGGWLILVVISLVVSPVRIGYFMATDILPIFRDGAWSILTTPGSAAYHVLWGPLLIFETIGNLGTIALGLTTLWFLAHKSRRTPKLAIAWLLWSSTLVVVDFFVTDLIPAAAAHPDPGSARELVRALVSLAIWVPYFLVSKRVKATFVN
jgi:hypothetical protein